VEDLLRLSPFILVCLGGIFVWLGTSLGAATVYFLKSPQQKILDISLGFAAGLMLSASFFSLLLPAIEMERMQGHIEWIAPVLGFILGVAFIKILDITIPHLHALGNKTYIEGHKSKLKKTTLLTLAIIIHNIPEGLAIGVAFASIDANNFVGIAGAISLTIGIAIQDFPEGLAVSFPLLKEGNSKWRAFAIGQLSGFVEFLSAIMGFIAVYFIQGLLPYALSFAAGAMTFVVIEELLPESQNNQHNEIATISTLGGFVLMMFLDLVL